MEHIYWPVHIEGRTKIPKGPGIVSRNNNGIEATSSFHCKEIKDEVYSVGKIKYKMGTTML